MESMRNTYERMRQEILSNPSLIYWPFQVILQELGFSWAEKSVLMETMLGIFRDEASEQAAAEKVWKLLGSRAAAVQEKLRGRSDQIFEQVSPYITGDRVLDFGCGDAQVAGRLHNKEVTLYDVIDYREPSTQNLKFSANWEEFKGKKFDSALAVAVFHHCDEPNKELRSLSEVANKIVIVESVIDETMPWPAQAFVDWLYNRGMHPGAAIPVPGNFRSVVEWRETFARLGYTITEEKDLGIDLPVVPEHHYLFVLSKYEKN